MALLEVVGIRRCFYGVTALAGVDVRVEAGTITGLIGPNGAGKTTLFNIVTGLLPAAAGTVIFDGQDITGWRPDRITRRGLVRTFQIARGFPRLTVMENLLLYGTAQPGERLWHALARFPGVRQREAELVERAYGVAAKLRLTPVLNQPASDISGGQKKLLELGRALMTAPQLILLDEPVAGVNPTLADELAQHLLRLRDEGFTLLVIEHDMSLVARLCNPVIVMSHGQTLAVGTFAEVAANLQVQEAYMGQRTWANS
jgi:ABC-type branched-subunit amino acid transport system ATPase component